MAEKFNPAALAEFARYYGFHYDRIDPHALKEDVLVEMNEGLMGNASSLAMIPSYISPVSNITPGKAVIALDAGGTNLRSALVKFDEKGKAEIIESLKIPMPGSTGLLGADEFFNKIAGVTKPLMEKAESIDLKIEGIGFCFSYHMDITEDADGILKTFSKEVNAPEVIGRAIGKGLREALGRMNVKAPEKIILLNDTVATLLCGLAEISPHGGQRRGEDHFPSEAGPMLGFILGTGFNTAYPETDIPKINFSSAAKPQIIVCESGNYAHPYMGIMDREFDSGTRNPGTYLLEKAASGAYLGPLTFHIMKKALSEKLFAFNRAEEFISIENFETKDLNQFMHEPLAKTGLIRDLFGSDENNALKSFMYLTSIVTERGAVLSASVLAAAMEKASAIHDPLMPVRVAVEGTTYMIYKGMRRSLESYLHLILNRDKPFPYAISPVEQASLLGAAVAALS